MLWWDDNVPKEKDTATKGHSGTGEIGDGEEMVSCYRSAGAIPVPRKIKSSKGSAELPKLKLELPNMKLELPNQKLMLPKPKQELSNKKLELPKPKLELPVRKLSVQAPEVSTPLPRRKLTCPGSPAPVKKPEPRLNKPKVRLNKPMIETLKDELKEVTFDLLCTLNTEKAECCTTGKTQVKEKSVVFKPKVIKDKPKAQCPVIKEELKRGSMKDKWGLKLVYQMSQDGGLCLAVLKVTSFTAGHKAKLQPGDHVITINDWQIDSMDQPQVAANIFKGAGFSVILGLERSNLNLVNWNFLDDF